MALEQYTSMHSVDFLNGGVVDVSEEDIKEQIEMLPSCWPSICIVVDCDPKDIVHGLLHSLHQLE